MLLVSEALDEHPTNNGTLADTDKKIKGTDL